MQKRNPLPVYKLTLGALYIAVFALASNVPFFSAIQIIPGVPITLQVFLVAMIGLTLGLRGGLATYFAVMLLTLCGLPLMSGGKGGAAGLCRAHQRVYIRLGVYNRHLRRLFRLFYGKAYQ